MDWQTSHSAMPFEARPTAKITVLLHYEKYSTLNTFVRFSCIHRPHIHLTFNLKGHSDSCCATEHVKQPKFYMLLKKTFPSSCYRNDGLFSLWERDEMRVVRLWCWKKSGSNRWHDWKRYFFYFTFGLSVFLPASKTNTLSFGLSLSRSLSQVKDQAVSLSAPPRGLETGCLVVLAGYAEFFCYICLCVLDSLSFLY